MFFSAKQSQANTVIEVKNTVIEVKQMLLALKGMCQKGSVFLRTKSEIANPPTKRHFGLSKKIPVFFSPKRIKNIIFKEIQKSI